MIFIYNNKVLYYLVNNYVFVNFVALFVKVLKNIIKYRKIREFWHLNNKRDSNFCQI